MDSVLIIKRRENLIVLDAGLMQVIPSGVIVNSMLVQKIIALNIADYAENFHVIYLSTNMTQSMIRRAHSSELDC